MSKNTTRMLYLKYLYMIIIVINELVQKLSDLNSLIFVSKIIDSNQKYFNTYIILGACAVIFLSQIIKNTF